MIVKNKKSNQNIREKSYKRNFNIILSRIDDIGLKKIMKQNQNKLPSQLELATPRVVATSFRERNTKDFTKRKTTITIASSSKSPKRKEGAHPSSTIDISPFNKNANTNLYLPVCATSKFIPISEAELTTIKKPEIDLTTRLSKRISPTHKFNPYLGLPVGNEAAGSHSPYEPKRDGKEDSLFDFRRQDSGGSTTRRRRQQKRRSAYEELKKFQINIQEIKEDLASPRKDQEDANPSPKDKDGKNRLMINSRISFNPNSCRKTLIDTTKPHFFPQGDLLDKPSLRSFRLNSSSKKKGSSTNTDISARTLESRMRDTGLSTTRGRPILSESTISKTLDERPIKDEYKQAANHFQHIAMKLKRKIQSKNTLL